VEFAAARRRHGGGDVGARLAIALLLVRYDFPGRGLFGYLTLIPIISPPLVGVLGFTFIMGKAGTVNILLEDWFGWRSRSTSSTASTVCCSWRRCTCFR